MEESYITITVLVLTISALASSILMLLRSLLKKRVSKTENEEIKVEVQETIKNIQDSQNIIELLKQHVAESKGYYIISKQQAQKSFSSALFVSFLGFILYALGIAINYININPNNIVIYTTIAGSIVEIISALFFWLYKNSIKQLNIYHQRLGATEKYLTAMQLIEKMSPNIQDQSYKILMLTILKDNSFIVQQNNNVNKQNREQK